MVPYLALPTNVSFFLRVQRSEAAGTNDPARPWHSFELSNAHYQYRDKASLVCEPIAWNLTRISHESSLGFEIASWGIIRSNSLNDLIAIAL